MIEEQHAVKWIATGHLGDWGDLQGQFNRNTIFRKVNLKIQLQFTVVNKDIVITYNLRHFKLEESVDS